MGLYTGTVKGISRAPYRDQVMMELIGRGHGTDKLTEKEEAKIERVKRFLWPEDCAREIVKERGWPTW